MDGKIKACLAAGVVVALLISGTPVFGQQRHSRVNEKGAAGYFTTGVGWILESGDSSIVYSAGGGGHSIRNRWILGGEGHSSFGPEYAGGFGFFDLGYLLLGTDLILVYPVLGLGGGAMTSDVSSTVSKCALLNPGVGLDFLVSVKGKAGLLIGVRAGYTFTVYSNTFDWSMPYIRLVAGGYGFGE